MAKATFSRKLNILLFCFYGILDFWAILLS
jgi:hypothetical protein